QLGTVGQDRRHRRADPWPCTRYRVTAPDDCALERKSFIQNPVLDHRGQPAMFTTASETKQDAHTSTRSLSPIAAGSVELPRTPGLRERRARLQHAVGNRSLLKVLRHPMTVQRKCGCDGSMNNCQSCSENRGGPQGFETPEPGGGVPRIVHQSLRGAGQPLDTLTRTFFEPRFGRDFGGVRIHTDTTAARSAAAVNARAYTVGDEVVFAAGQYAPGTVEGRRLLAHELTHTIQQSGQAQFVGNSPVGISQPSDRAELEASEIAYRVLVGERASPLAQESARVLHRVPPTDPAKPSPPDELLDPFAIECPEIPAGRWVKQVVVKQETPQTVTATWDDGTTSSGECSTGKGHCCVDNAAPTGVECT